ncbi:MAG: hypothetical protein V1861_04190 [Candidatus Micrarchaeota archaeon]
MRAQYVGLPVAPLLTQPPPIVVEVPDAEVLRLSGGQSADGYYIPNTNIIVVSASTARDPALLNEVILHEMNHYAGWRGHGFNNAFSNGGTLSAMPNLVWLEEGLANSGSSGLIGATTRPIAYPYETMTAVLLERVAGPAAVREAYASGDYRRLQQIVNERLGEGTFETVIGLRQRPDGSTISNGAEALDFLRGAIERNPGSADMGAFWADPRIQRSTATIREEMRSGMD